jgi:AcrR family transcriptional regulator
VNTRTRIAADLERTFATLGFAQQGVEALRAGADVSLRTLYKHFPSREAMIVGALEHRDKVYFEWLAGGPAEGVAHVLYPLDRLGKWLERTANTGCLFLNALAQYPDSAAIAAAVRDHKMRLADVFRQRLARVAPGRDCSDLAATLFILHEGMTEVARLQRLDLAWNATMKAARVALAAEGIT